MPRLLPFALALALPACFGQPEDVFFVEGRVFDFTGDGQADASVAIERDRGATADGCTAFAPFTALRTDENGTWRLNLIRQQTRGTVSDHRCFRATVTGLAGSRSVMTWVFGGNDLYLRAMRPWPFNGPSVSSSIASFATVPSQYPAELEGAGPVAYRAEVVSDGGTVWRSHAEGRFSLTARLPARALAGQPDGTARVIAVAQQRVVHYERDPFGQLKVDSWQWRVESPPVLISLPTLSPAPIPGITCGLNDDAGRCLFTDRDPTGVKLPPATNQLTFTFPEETLVSEIYLQRLAVTGEWTELKVDVSTTDNEAFELTNTTVSGGKVNPALALAAVTSLGDPAPTFDVGPLRPSSGVGFASISVRRLRIRAIGPTGSLDLAWLGEITFF